MEKQAATQNLQRPRPTPPAVAAGYRQPEAYNLMYYHNEKTGLGFLVLNPRDGVTPFCCIVEGVEYRHAWWGLDRFLPGFTPQPGMHYFRDRTPAEATAAAEKRLAQFDGTEHEVAPENRARALASIVQDFLRTPLLDRAPL
jgi:hypothetical protein